MTADREALRRRVLLALPAVSALLLVVAGCSGGTRPAPTTVKDCSDAYFGGPDGGVIAGLDWRGGNWALGTPAPAYICVANYAGSTVRLVQSGEQLTIQPAEQTVPLGGGVLPVSITATASGKTELTLRVLSSSGEPEVSRTVATVVAGNKKWHFKRVHD